jgi:hypothetical protein
MSTGPLTGVTNSYVTGDKPTADEWNTLINFLDSGLGRFLVQTMMENGVMTRETPSLVIDTTAVRIDVPGSGQPAVGCIGGKFFYMDDTMEVASTADSGTTTTLVDATLTQGSGFWVGGYVIFTSGLNSGVARKITGYDSTTDTLSWTTPLSNAVVASDGYVVTFYYIQGLTNSVLNYVFGKSVNRTISYFTIEFYANTTGTPDSANDILLSTVTLNGSGVVTASNNSPTGADRTLYKGLGSYHEETITGTLVSVPAGGSVDVTETHEYLLLRGGMTIAFDDVDFEASDVQIWAPDSVTFTVTNTSSYVTTVTYTLVVGGRQRGY